MHGLEKKYQTVGCVFIPELSTGKMDPRVGSGRVGSGWVTILPDFGGSGRVSTSFFLFFQLIISWYLNRY